MGHFRYINSNVAPRLGGIKQKKLTIHPSKLVVISFVLFPQASEPSWNFNKSEMVY